MFGLPTKDEDYGLEPAIDKCPVHTRRIFNPLEFKNVAKWAVKEIERLRPDAIVACGHSGLLLAGVVSYATGIPTFAVRKPDEYTVANSSSVSGISLHGKAKRWVWLDDFVSTGSTLRRCAIEVYKAGLVKEPFPVACVCYGTFQEEGPLSSYQANRIAEELEWTGFIPSSIERIGYLQ